MTFMRIGLLAQGNASDTPARVWLQEAGHTVDRFHCLMDLKACLLRETFDLVLVDDALLGERGDEQVSRLLSLPCSQVSLMVFNARDNEARLAGMLHAGAEDFLVRDIGRQSFLARISAVLRRLHPALHRDPSDLICLPYRLDLQRRLVYLRESPVPLTDKEFELVLYLFRNLGRLLSRGHLLDAVWRKSGSTNSRTIDTHISRLRNKLEFGTANGYRLIAGYGTGYRLERLTPEPGDLSPAPRAKNPRATREPGRYRPYNWPMATAHRRAASWRSNHALD